MPLERVAGATPDKNTETKGETSGMPLFWRIWGAVTLVIFAVLSLFVVLATMQFNAIHSTLVGERLVVLADRTVAPFSAAVRLGLALSSVRNATALLERARQTDDAIVALHVFDDVGRIVHSTLSSPPAAVPAFVGPARAAAGGDYWYRQTPEGFVGSVDLVGERGRSAGGILVVYSPIGHATQVRAIFAELMLGAIAALALAAALAAVLLRWGLSAMIRRHRAIEATVRDFERGAWRGAAGRARAKANAEDADGLREGLEAARARYRAVGRRLSAASQETT
ncbi:MAG: hypothetical protein LT102_13085 [Burkholderiaceae bacterium]|nr:hypothetical protein [Burkholderiaceae bacterium]